jgi:hypothetical protein
LLIFKKSKQANKQTHSYGGITWGIEEMLRNLCLCYARPVETVRERAKSEKQNKKRLLVVTRGDNYDKM